jgi:hypothetical protein
MADTQITVFSARTPRSYIVSATLSATSLTAWVLGRALWSSGTSSWVLGAWIKGTLVLAGLFASVTLILWSSRLRRDKHRTVSVMASGLQTPQGYCAWDAITEAKFLDVPDDPHILIKGRHSYSELVIPLQVTEDGSFRRLVEQYAGQDNPLIGALIDAGA